MIKATQSLQSNLLGNKFIEYKEHLFARVLVERSEEINNLSLEEIKTKIGDNFGAAALDVLEDLLHEMDLSYFNDHNDIKNLFELANYAKLCYSDHLIRRRLISNLGYKYFVKLMNQENKTAIVAEVLFYVADAIAFLAKNKIQFVEDFGCLFNAVDVSETGDNKDFVFGKYDLGNRMLTTPGSDALTVQSNTGRILSVRDFSATLQEAAYHDLTVGNYKTMIHGWKSNSMSRYANEVGANAYWDIFFWLCPGSWLKRTLKQTVVII